ncbi:MAG: DUF2490 domain-containing protein [Bacteroidota bacterium]
MRFFYSNSTFLCKTATVGLLLLCFLPTFGQAPRTLNVNNVFWSEVNLSGKIKGKFGYQLDYQFRTQGESDKVRDQVMSKEKGMVEGAHGKYNIVAFPGQQVIRPWISYKLNDKIKVSISPFGWWRTWTPTSDSSLNFQPEFRSTLQLALTQPLGRVTITQRYRYEFRFLGKELPTNGSAGDDYYSGMTDPGSRRGRFRYMVRAIIPLNHQKMEPKTYYIHTYNEILISIGHNVKPERILDQNRAFLGLGYKFSPALRVELGYLNQYIPKGATSDMNNAVQLLFVVDDVNSFFKRKNQ